MARLSREGLADLFSLAHGRYDLLPMALAAILAGAAAGRKQLRLTVQVVLIGLVFFFLARAIHKDWAGITEYPWTFDLPWLLLSIVFFTITYIGHATGWLLLLRLFKQEVPLLPAMYVWFKSLIARYVPGNVLMIVGRVMMIRPYGVPRRISLTSIAYEQALLGVSATIVLSIALPFWTELREISSLIWLVLAVPPLAVIMMHPAILGRLGNFVFRLVGREPIEEFLPLKSVLGLIVFYCLLWVTSGAALFAMARAVTDQIVLGDVPIAIASVPLAWLVSVLFFIFPSGLGVREGIYSYTLRFAFDSEGVASAFSILARFWQTLIEIGIVFITMGVIKLWYEKHDHKEIEPLVPAEQEAD
ncbi:MAG: UPF0104 family protein [Gaiellales bacterium]|nr:MAG: UPF0104 family protein [Gaiellales bacterium]